MLSAVGKIHQQASEGIQLFPENQEFAKILTQCEILWDLILEASLAERMPIELTDKELAECLDDAIQTIGIQALLRPGAYDEYYKRCYMSVTKQSTVPDLKLGKIPLEMTDELALSILGDMIEEYGLKAICSVSGYEWLYNHAKQKKEARS